MLDERKVKLMTKLALYEHTQGKEDFKISEYYRKDYAGMHVFSSFIWVTIGYMCLAVLLVLAGFDALMDSMSNSLMLMMLMIFVVGYFGVVVIYAVISSHIFNQKHKEARMRVKKYNHDLTRLLKWYEREKK
ncbi:MAG: hypothetical protein HFH01_03870 [Dorea sp.]|nr:hypothetical protein [Dorea sp.]